MLNRNLRLEMLQLLSESSRSYSELKKALKVSDPTVSKHLSTLEKEGLIAYSHSERTYSIQEHGRSYLAKLSVLPKLESMPVASISPKNFEKIWKKISRSESVTVMHESLDSMMAFLTKEERQKLREGKFEMPLDNFIPATAFFWFDRKNQDLLHKVDDFAPIVNNIIAIMRMHAATARKGKKPTGKGIESVVKELKWLKANYDFECAILVHFDARNKALLRFLEEQIRRGEERIRSTSKDRNLFQS